MPSFIDGDLYVGRVVGGSLILKNGAISVVSPPPSQRPDIIGGITDTVPTKPPTSGGVRDVDYPNYIPSGNERMILFDGGKNLMTADVADGKGMLANGWKLVGMFDRATAEQVADKIAKNPPPDSAAIMNHYNSRRVFAMSLAGAAIPMAYGAQKLIREKQLANGLAQGSINPPYNNDPEYRAQIDAQMGATWSQITQNYNESQRLAQFISNVLSDIPTLQPQVVQIVILAKTVFEENGRLRGFPELNTGSNVLVTPINKALLQAMNNVSSAFGGKAMFMTVFEAPPPYGEFMHSGKTPDGHFKITKRIARIQFPFDAPYSDDAVSAIQKAVNDWNAKNENPWAHIEMTVLLS